MVMFEGLLGSLINEFMIACVCGFCNDKHNNALLQMETLYNIKALADLAKNIKNYDSSNKIMQRWLCYCTILSLETSVKLILNASMMFIIRKLRLLLICSFRVLQRSSLVNCIETLGGKVGANIIPHSLIKQKLTGGEADFKEWF